MPEADLLGRLESLRRFERQRLLPGALFNFEWRDETTHATEPYCRSGRCRRIAIELRRQFPSHGKSSILLAQEQRIGRVTGMGCFPRHLKCIRWRGFTGL